MTHRHTAIGTYENRNIFHSDTPSTYEELLEDPRYKKMPPLEQDAAAAKFLHMSYGQYQGFKMRQSMTHTHHDPAQIKEEK